MKNTLITIMLVVSAMTALAQVKMTNLTFKTADGKVIPADKLESVKAALGPNVQFMHKAAEPNVMYLIVQSSASQKAETESKAKFAAMIGKPAPNFSMTDLPGKKYDLGALKGKVIVLNFWFTACSGCIAEMPDLNKIKTAYKAEPVVFLAFALDKKEPLKKFLKTHNFRYAILPDARKTHKDYGIYACPVSMVIDRKGVVTHIFDAGENVVKGLPEAIDAAISK